jgi:apolipoprotein N-acyltransferase
LPALFLLPEAVAGCVLLAYSARLSVGQGLLVLRRGQQRLDIALKDIAAVRLWRLPTPGRGLTLHLKSALSPTYHLATADPARTGRRAGGGGRPVHVGRKPRRARRATPKRWRSVRRGRLDSPWVKFLLFPLLLALPAFHLHQNIAYGGWLRRASTPSVLRAYGLTFAIWWATWSMGVVLCAAALRAVVEAATLLTLAVHLPQTAAVRATLERMALAVLYLGLPGWLLLHASW